MIMETFLTYFFVGGFYFVEIGICLIFLYELIKHIIKDIMDELNNN